MLVVVETTQAEKAIISHEVGVPVVAEEAVKDVGEVAALSTSRVRLRPRNTSQSRRILSSNNQCSKYLWRKRLRK